MLNRNYQQTSFKLISYLEYVLSSRYLNFILITLEHLLKPFLIKTSFIGKFGTLFGSLLKSVWPKHCGMLEVSQLVENLVVCVRAMFLLV